MDAVKLINNIMSNNKYYNDILSQDELDEIFDFLSLAETEESSEKQFIIAHSSNDLCYYHTDTFCYRILQKIPFNRRLYKLLVANDCIKTSYTGKDIKYTISLFTFIQYITDYRVFLSSGTCTIDEMNNYYEDNGIEKIEEIDVAKYQQDKMKTFYDGNRGERDSKEYKQFIKTVLERDNYTCQCCGSKNNPQVHHVLNYSSHKKLRIDVNNGITLCECCHSPMIFGSFHQTYGTYNNTKEQLDEYIKNHK